MSTLRANKEVVRRLWEEVIGNGRFEFIGELIADDLIDHTNPPDWPPGLEGARQIIGAFRQGFSGWHCPIDDLIAEGDMVVVRGTFRGTHTGTFMGIPPTGRPVQMPGIHILRLHNGKIVEHWAQNDDLGFMQQLGAIPETA